MNVDDGEVVLELECWLVPRRALPRANSHVATDLGIP